MHHRFGLLGPVLVRLDDGRYARLSGRQRAVLATLLLNANTVVSRDRLEAAVWDDPPISAVANLQTYIAQLRRIGPVAPRLVTMGSGYVLQVARDEVDLFAFRDELELARLEGDPAARAGRLRHAIGLWRGRAAEDAPLSAVMGARLAELDEQLAEARCDWAAAELTMGRHAEVIGELRAFVAEHPLWERAWEQLILALSQAGRRAEALSAYRQARAALVADLGIEPGPALRELQYDILSGELPSPWRPVCQLPADIADFVGREGELARVSALCSPDAHAPPVVVIAGPPGVGKSTLAVHAAHLARAAFPDGQLYLRLGGPSPRGPAALLAELLRALNAHVIPDSAEERAALYRSLVADRSMLIVLEDAAGEHQVTPLLPGTSRCAVLVTSRGPLTALPGASVVQLAAPPLDEARTLLERVAGAARVRADPGAAASILRACGRLPLAVRIAGARLAARPAWPLRDLADRLASVGKLDELALGGHDVRANFAISYEALPAAARRAFRLLGLAGLGSIAEWAVAALVDDPRREAEQSMETLTLAGLVTAGEADQNGQSRYRMHDLLAAYARERAHAEEDPVRQGEALARFTAECLRRLREAAEDYPPPMIPSAPRPAVEKTAGDGHDWLHAERETLITAVTLAEPRTAAELAYLLSPFLVVTGFADEATAMLEGVARRAPDRRTAMVTRLLLADIALEHRRMRVARPWLEELAGHFAAEGDRHANLYVSTGLGICHLLEGEPERARPLLDRAIAGFEALGDRGGLVNALITAVHVRIVAGEHDEAIALCHRGLRLTDERRYGDYAVRFHRSLGISLYEMGRTEEAIGHYEESIGLSRELGWGPGEPITLRRLGEAYGRLGRFEEAAAVLARCLDLFARAGDAYGEALTAYTLGELSLGQSRPDEALSFFTRCRDLTDEPGLRARAGDRIDELSTMR
ncbi:AfsR/SARP family transcriptional regulator [Nonomuraea basaltis]|uniref:AfsR/SARP family transcriptional regulator n=1 Tax=Nonomuraea basaltis TaxID=2495887 RepID=UPI00110C6EE7|nr:BTAD domain-containing putative transcriptional regulator [Nonomuraea basaltis]TMR98870.1 tetratricopeptide repeat protein [Nonomuraea basaltis]